MADGNVIKRKRINYYDTLRVLAILGIITLHIFQRWKTGDVLGMRIYAFSEITRFAVPVFLMMSGALLLNREMPISVFFKKRFSRICYPFVLYILIYIGVLLFILNTFPGFEDINRYLGYLPFGWNWYFWMILGVYLSIPIIDVFIRHAKESELKYFVAMLFVASLFYQITLYFKISHAIYLNFFVAPLTFIILGYYLSIKEFKLDAKKIITIALIIFALTTAIKIWSQMGIIPYNLIHNYQATRSPIVSSYLDLGFLQLIQAGSFFVAFRYLYECKTGIYGSIRGLLENGLVTKFNTSVSKASYGMYLFHHTLIEPIGIFVKKLALTGTEICLSIVFLSLFVFFVSWIVVLCLNKIPFVNKICGYH